MAVPELVRKLTNDHRSLEAAIAQERCRPQPDEKRIKDLKREKLRIKDRLSSLTADASH
jgi:hypothetical protein